MLATDRLGSVRFNRYRPRGLPLRDREHLCGLHGRERPGDGDQLRSKLSFQVVIADVDEWRGGMRDGGEK